MKFPFITFRLLNPAKTSSCILVSLFVLIMFEYYFSLGKMRRKNLRFVSIALALDALFWVGFEFLFLICQESVHTLSLFAISYAIL